MNQYEMTLVAISEKRAKIYAESPEEAAELLEKVYHKTNILDFTNEDVTDISVAGMEVNSCENCGFYCVECGGCTAENSRESGKGDCENCHFQCAKCGRCTCTEGDKQS